MAAGDWPTHSIECSSLRAGVRLQKLSDRRETFNTYKSSWLEGYRIRVLDGDCAGVEGYVIFPIIEGGSCS